jgi:glycosyltransferase involved in cell wall biosynthesis
LRVFVNGRFASQAVTGVQRYAAELVGAMDQELGRDGRDSPSCQILAPSQAIALPTLEHISVRRVGRLRGHAWEQWELPWYARGGLLLSLANTGPLLKRRQIVTIHDVSPLAMPSAYSPAFRRWYGFLLPTLARTARLVVTDSEFSRSELSRYARIEGSKVRVIGLSGDHIRRVAADGEILRRLQLRPRGYALTVGSQSPHKNLKVVAEAMGRLADRTFDVVVTGGYDPRIFARAGMTAFPPGTKLAGYVSDGALRALYENAGCFIYPSLYEGFGLPPLEAMVCGCPVIVSTEAALPEVCGSAAVYCDARDPASVADSIARVMSDCALQDRLRSLGRERARLFDWATAARSMLQAIQEVGRRA